MVHVQVRPLLALTTLILFIALRPGAFGSRQQATSWSTRSFNPGDVPCLPLKQDKNFSLQSISSQDNAYLMMAASYLAYSFWPGKRQRILKSWGFENVHLFDDSLSSTNGYWAEQKEFILVAFRGTQEPTDILTDFTVHLVPEEAQTDAQRLVHRGFKRGADSVAQHVRDAAQRARELKKPLFLAGHSLGGALALLSALQLERENIVVDGLWTFGAPKVGNSVFFEHAKRQLKERWHRINEASDPIPALPFTFADQQKVQRWAEKIGAVVPVLRTLAQHADYDVAPIADLPSHSVAHKPISARSAKEIAWGFLRHLPRAYVCNLSGNQHMPQLTGEIQLNPRTFP